MPQFPELKNDTVIKAAFGLPTDYTPVWIMRQAGRYLPEFRKAREQHDFFKICRTPELACEVTLQPIERFNLDAAIIFSDILVIPQALGMEIQMKPKEGPVFTEPLQAPDEIDKKLNLKVDVRSELKYVYDAITLTRTKLDGKVPLIGFSGAPWTLFAYMIEGSTSKTQSKAKKWLYKYESESLRLLNCLADLIVVYLIEQVRAGAQLVQIFESHLGYLTPDLFAKFSLPLLQRIVQQVRSGLRAENIDLVPIIFFGKDGDHFAIEQLAKGENYFDVISVDWTMDPRFARRLVGDDVTLQGNLDPCALYSEPAKLEQLVKEMIERFGKEKHIANLGHGIYPDMDPESVKVFVDSVHKYSKK